MHKVEISRAPEMSKLMETTITVMAVRQIGTIVMTTVTEVAVIRVTIRVGKILTK